VPRAVTIVNGSTVCSVQSDQGTDAAGERIPSRRLVLKDDSVARDHEVRSYRRADQPSSVVVHRTAMW